MATVSVISGKSDGSADSLASASRAIAAKATSTFIASLAETCKRRSRGITLLNHLKKSYGKFAVILFFEGDNIENMDFIE